ncbi:phosphatidylinositol-4- kinase [Coemansia brasiliensis]|uniref:1-phosphatidylinositol 4-kinase n=1 Tax=Coemansia brasiliensis TaxID=2650707 RepID=A0A9W8I913_9FUNG|nr:phosphatidylinositol-4- kinase [Coemansia brasiliensis]
MELLNLHSQILEELSSILAAASPADSEICTELERIQLQCPELPETTELGPRHQNGILALASLAYQSADMRPSVLDQVLGYYSSLESLSIIDSIAYNTTANKFVKELTVRLLNCASLAPEHRATIMEHIWGLVGRALSRLPSKSHEQQLLGALAAIQQTSLQFTAHDVSKLNAAIEHMAKVTASNVLGQFLAAAQAVLESRASQSLAGDRSNELPLWQQVARGSRLLSSTDESERQAYARVAAFSEQTYAAAAKAQTAAAQGVMQRALETAGLASVLAGNEGAAIDCSLEHINGPYAEKLPELTAAAFRVLVIAASRGVRRDAVTAACIGFLAQDQPESIAEIPAAAALAACARGADERAVAALRTLAAAAPQRRAVQACGHLAAGNAAAAAAAAARIDVLLDTAAEIAAAVAPAAFADVVGAALQRVDNASAREALIGLVSRIGQRRDAVEAFVGASLRAGVDAMTRGNNASAHAAVLTALVQTPAYTQEQTASLAQIALWRAFWMHAAARGQLQSTEFDLLAARTPCLVHETTVSSLDVELDATAGLQHAPAEAIPRLRTVLAPLSGPQTQGLIKNSQVAQLAFLAAILRVETARAACGDCATVLRYFGNPAVAAWTLLPVVERVAGSAGTAACASCSPATLRALLEAACDRRALVASWGRRLADRIICARPHILVDARVLEPLLELLHLVWRSCAAARHDQFEPVFWFRAPGLELLLPDEPAYRDALLTRLSACARRWLGLAAAAAPMELEAQLLAYLSTPTDQSMHVGRALALDVGTRIKFSSTDSQNVLDLPPNAAPFAARLSQRALLRAQSADVSSLKRSLATVLEHARANPGDALPGGTAAAQEVVLLLFSAAHAVAAAGDRELLRLLAWVPVALLDTYVMRAAQFAWTMLVVDVPARESLLMAELSVAWTWLAQQHLGLFSRRFEPKQPFAAKMSYSPSDKSSRARAFAEISRALDPHRQLIEFLAQRFAAVRHISNIRTSIVAAVRRIMRATFDYRDRLSSSALARAPLFMLVRLGFSLLSLKTEPSQTLDISLRDGLFKLALRWFALPPCWSFSGSTPELAQEVQILIDVHRVVKDSSAQPSSLTARPSTGSLASSVNSSIGGNMAEQPPSPVKPHHPHLRHLNPLSRHHRRHSSRAHIHSADNASAASLSKESEHDTTSKQRTQHGHAALLLLLLENEISRMATWANPTSQPLSYFPDISQFIRPTEMSEQGWHNLVLDAWAANPSLALQLSKRFSHPTIARVLTQLICKYPGELVHEPEAIELMIRQLHAEHLSFRELKFLLYWSPVPPISSTAYLASSYATNPLALQYAVRALESFPVDITFFYIPQLVQALRHDSLGYAERAILSSARISQHFAHQIIWNMNANMYKDEDSQEPDSLKPVLDRIISTIVDGLSGDDRDYYEKEFGFFNKVTGISGKLKPFIKKPKEEKKRKIDEEMKKIKVEPGVYLPSNPDGTVVDIDYTSGRPLQSHAKAPFMATFIISKPKNVQDEVQELLKRSEHTVTPTSSQAPSDPSDSDSTDILQTQQDVSLNLMDRPTMASSPHAHLPDVDQLSSKLAGAKLQIQRTLSSALSDAPDLIGISPHEQPWSGRPSLDSTRSQNLHRKKKPKSVAHNSSEDAEQVTRLSAIFKVGDDCRQDVLALQLIAVFKNIFTSCGLDLYLYPYRVVATAPGCGVIDVIPNSISRDQMGREKVNSLSDYFATRYHGKDSIEYQQARSNFVQSLAAYSVLSYLLQFKDRHNGNIMLDDQGHIVHIDFGFILDIAPGGITFESAPFKLTSEYIQVMGGSTDAQPYRMFCELCIKAYLASRPYAHLIIQIVQLMLDSGLPCFKGEATLNKLRARFQLEKTEREAAQFMADRISDSYENKWTVMYDQFQKATNGIPY